MKFKGKFKHGFTILLVMLFIFTLGFGVGCAPKEKPAETKPPEEVKAPEQVAEPPVLDHTENLIVEAAEGMVAAAHPLAALAGAEMLMRGGNAIDAAVATGFALNVVEPMMSSMGGGGFMLYYDAETSEVTAIDFREVAPAKASETMYEIIDGKVKDAANDVGHLAVAVPGNVAGHFYALENFGSMTREQVLGPAIRYAEEGIPVMPYTSTWMENCLPRLNKFPASSANYLKDGMPYAVGDILYQKDLAKSMRIVAEKGVDGFYKGVIAEAIAKNMSENGGIITLEDLANYPQVRPRIFKPAEGTYRGYKIISMPPPSSGGTHLVQLLNILENFDMLKLGHNSTESIHIMAEAFKFVYADRAKYMGDPEYVKMPLEGLLSKEYAKEVAGKIQMDKVSLKPEAGDPTKYGAMSLQPYEDSGKLAYYQNLVKESVSTTSFSTIDSKGNMVSVTQTTNYPFGSAVVVPGTGISLNNQMSNFVPGPGTANSVQPGKTPLSSTTPTLVLSPDGKPFVSLGSTGAIRIYPAVMQILVNMIDYGMNIQQAMEAGRVFSFTDELFVENSVPASVVDALKALGHEVVSQDSTGAAQGVQIDRERSRLLGGFDPRADGKAVGY